jgi:peptide/nickel transport system permease protein
MFRYILRRIAQSVIVLIGVSILAFSVMFLAGDPTYLYVSERSSAEEIEATRRALGFDKPVHIQYITWLGKAVQGDFGISTKYNQPAMKLVLDRLPATLELTFVGMIVAVLFAIPLGVIAAAKRNSIFDNLMMIIAMIGQSIPEFWLGLMLILIVGVEFRLLPISGRIPIFEPLFTGQWEVLKATFGDAVRYIIMPGIASGVWSLSRNARLVRSSMLEVLGMDYVTTARAKGVNNYKVIMKHAFKNALIPIVTIVGLEFGFLIGGNVIIENVFAWPGVGRLVVFAINQRDFNVVQASVITLAMLFVLLNLLVDVMYTWLDPRIRYS